MHRAGFKPYTNLLSLLIYFYLFQSTIRVLNINKLIKYTRGIHDFYLSFLQSTHILISLNILLLLVQNLGGSHPTHATIRSRKARHRSAFESFRLA